MYSIALGLQKLFKNMARTYAIFFTV